MSPISIAIRIGIFLCIFACIEYYAFQSAKTIIADWSDAARKTFTYIWWAIPVILIAIFLVGGRNGFDSISPHFANYFRAFFTVILLTKLLMAVIMLGDDLRRGALWLYSQFATKPVNYSSRSRFLATTAVLLGALPFLTLTYGMLRNMYRYTLKKVDIPVADLPAELEGLRIVQISDIHSGTFTQKEPIFKAIEMINAQNPDIVFFTGDLVNNVATEIVEYIDVFDKIKAKHGVFSILGNHDYGDYVEWENEAAKAANLVTLGEHHKTMGWDLLRNENRILDINGQKLAIIGVENFSAKLNFPKHGRLAESYAGTEDAAMRILLSHDPSHWDYEVNKKFKDIALTLSGHTHGFQFGIEIPGFIKWSPSQYVYKQWGGLYNAGQQFIYVNRGFGALGYPGRVGILPEITLLTLRKA
jgi:uncharacterized protein